jgi:hypothetical protein
MNVMLKIICWFGIFCASAKAEDFLLRISNARMVKSSPVSIEDLNIILDVEISSKHKGGVFANVHGIGGNFFSEAKIELIDRKVIEKLGYAGFAPLSKNETNVFVFVSGNEGNEVKYTKIATICTNIKDDVGIDKVTTKASEVVNFSGKIKFVLDAFSTKENKFIPCKVSVKFSAKRLPTGGVMELKIGDAQLDFE